MDGIVEQLVSALRPLAIVAGLAYLVENLTEYGFQDTPLARYQKYVALGFGELLAFGFGIDILADWFGLPSVIPSLGTALSGVMLGRGSNFIHDVWKRIRTPEALPLAGPIEEDNHG